MMVGSLGLGGKETNGFSDVGVLEVVVEMKEESPQKTDTRESRKSILPGYHAGWRKRDKGTMVGKVEKWKGKEGGKSYAEEQGEGKEGRKEERKKKEERRKKEQGKVRKGEEM